MANTTNVEAKKDYEVNVMEWYPDKTRIVSKDKAKVSGSKKREKENGYISVKAYDGGYKGREGQDEPIME